MGTTSDQPLSSRRSDPATLRMLGTLGLLVALTMLAYLPAMQGGFIWDDDAHLPAPELRSLPGLAHIWFNLDASQQYYPLVCSFFWLEHKLWGDYTLGYHLVNVLLHATNACLVFGILRTLQVPGALLAAAIFALHPVHVESVAWISEQKNTLSASFFLGALWLYLRFDNSREPSRYWWALVLFVMGLLSKTVTATLPAVLLVIFWWQRGTLSWRRDVRPLVPFFALGAMAGLFTAWLERTKVGAQGAEFDLALVERLLLAGRVPWFYASKLAWPTDLIFTYPRWTIDATAAWQWLFPAATLGVLVVLCVVALCWRGPLAGVLLFLGTLFPVLGFLNVYPFVFSYVADHFQYLASLGLIVLAAAGMTLVAERALAKPVARALAVLLVGALAVLTWQQSRMYADVQTLYRTTLARNPDAWMAHVNLGVELADGERVEESIAHYREALRIKPDSAEAHYNLGNALAAQGKLEEAAAEYREAVRLYPQYAAALDNLGNTLSKLGQSDAAIEQLEAAVRLSPHDAEVQTNLGAALLSAGRTGEAIRHFQQALEWQPDDADAHSRLASALLATGRQHEALGHAEKAVELAPDSPDAYNNLGAALAQAGRFQEAVGAFEEAVRLRPGFAQAQGNLMAAYQQIGRQEDAVATAHQALASARASGQTELAAQIENWLDHYQATPAAAAE